jgi:hypothetical protein
MVSLLIYLKSQVALSLIQGTQASASQRFSLLIAEAQPFGVMCCALAIPSELHLIETGWQVVVGRIVL